MRDGQHAGVARILTRPRRCFLHPPVGVPGERIVRTGVDNDDQLRAFLCRKKG
jgi:hypothetical protein